jgi:hypothetical protein
MLKFAIPVLHVSSSVIAEQFFNRLGFRQEFAMRPDASKADPCYMGFKRDEVLLHVSSFSGDGVCGGVVYVAVDEPSIRNSSQRASQSIRDPLIRPGVLAKCM